MNQIKEENYEKYYDIGKLLSHNCMMNFVVSPRGNGKTFCAKRWCIKDFLKTGKEFAYVRRTKVELDDIDTFFDDIIPFFTEIEETKIIGNRAYINDGNGFRLCGRFFYLSRAANFKSKAFPNMNKIILDEFIPSGNRYTVIPYEVNQFLDLIYTIGRDRVDTKVVCLANNVRSVNPYFTFFNIKPPKQRFTKFKQAGICVEYFTSEAFIEEMKDTPFGRLVAGTEYANYAIGNEALEDSESFICDIIPNDSKFKFSIIEEGKEYGVWYSQSLSSFYCNTNIDKTSKYRYALNRTDHSENTKLVSYVRDNGHITSLSLMYNEGKVFFKDQEVKYGLEGLLKKIIGA